MTAPSHPGFLAFLFHLRMGYLPPADINTLITAVDSTPDLATLERLDPHTYAAAEETLAVLGGFVDENKSNEATEEGR